METASTVRNLEELDIDSNEVKIIHELHKESWGIRGSRPESEINLGFEVYV